MLLIDLVSSRTSLKLCVIGSVGVYRVYCATLPKNLIHHGCDVLSAQVRKVRVVSGGGNVSCMCGGVYVVSWLFGVEFCRRY
jgi:hypothetical protein